MAFKQQEAGHPFMQTSAWQHEGQFTKNPTAPIIVQPGMGQSTTNGNWIQPPQGFSNCPPGLQHLARIDHLRARHKVGLSDMMAEFESRNRYLISNSSGQKMYFVGEKSGWIARNCIAPIRPFELKIFDNFGQHVISLHRPLSCQYFCFPGCLQSMKVASPPGTVIGVIQQKWDMVYPKLVVKNPSGDEMFRVEGPSCTWSCCSDVMFNIYSSSNTASDTEIGTICKQWSGMVKEEFTDEDYFGITFPMDLDVKMKANLVGALFLIDMMFFETD